MTVSSNLVGVSSLELSDSELQGLTAGRLLDGLDTFLHTFETDEPAEQALRQLAEWWYIHFLVLALIDGTIYATHVNSYIAEASSDPYLNQCWPSVHLDGNPPGPGWRIAATDRKSPRLTSRHSCATRLPYSARK